MSVCGGSEEPQTSANAAGSSSAQVKRSDEVVPAGKSLPLLSYDA